jgi:hypothetical protein
MHRVQIKEVMKLQVQVHPTERDRRNQGVLSGASDG